MPATRFVLFPGVFRLALAYTVFFQHAVPVHLGIGAVFLFFMLSGYWVYQMGQSEYAATEAPYRTFIVSRVWRLMPVYYLSLAALLLTAWLWRADGVEPPSILSWAGLHTYVSHLLVLGYAPVPLPYRIFGPLWSLDIELQFYVVAPFIIVLLRKYHAFAPPRLALYVAALIGFACYVGLYQQSETTAFLPMYLLFFMIGTLSAHAGWRPDPRLAVALAGVAAAAIALCIALPATRPLLVLGSFARWQSAYNGDANIVLALLLAPYAMATVRRAPRAGSRMARLDRDLGNVTYEVYLLHPSVIAFEDHVIGSGSKTAHLALIGAMFVVLFPIAYTTYLLFDRPIDRLRRAYVKARRRMPQPVTP